MLSKRRQHIVIVGAGFGGVHAYLELHRKLHGTGRVEVTVINPTDYFVFTPLIHEVATGGLLPHSVTQSLRMLPRCCMKRLVLGHATDVDCDKKTVRVHLAGKPGDPHVPADDFEEIQYDYLILGMGSETNFFDVPGASEHTLQLNNVEHARRLKNHVLERFDHVQTLDNPEDQKHELSFVVVGGGPTGVEIAGELADFIQGIVTRSFPRLKEYARVLIIERGDQLLKRGIGEWFSRRATDILIRKKGVYILYDTSVTEVTADGARTDNGFIHSKTVIWGAGVVARTIVLRGKHDVTCEDRSCRILVDDYLQIPEHRNIFVVGDQAWVRDREHDQPYPMRAQFAVREGKHAAGNLISLMSNETLQPFSFRERGMIISLGRGGALAELFGVRFSGPIAWFVYRSAYLFSMVGWRNRLRTALEWTLNLFLSRDISKI